MEKFNNSLNFDKCMWAEDITGSKAYVKGLAQTGIVSQTEAAEICEGLDKVGSEWTNGTFQIEAGDEDIHTANERRLTELVGDVGKKLHTGRSRNDQVVTDARLWLRNQVSQAKQDMSTLIQVCCEAAEQHMDVLMAG
ncbi:unnamed protein product [Discosporangium mesarthrocarpum]